MKVSVRIDTAGARTQLRNSAGNLKRQVRLAARQALQQEGEALREEVHKHVAGQLKVVRKGFLKSFRTRVIDRDPQRLPALLVGSKIPWVGLHESGGAISGRMLIPLHGRVGRKRFKQQVSELMRGGNAYFVKNKQGHLVLMAENIKDHDRPLAGFKRRYRKAHGIAKLKRGADIPIAVLVPRVTLKKRLDVEQLTRRRLPQLAAAIRRQLLNLH